MTEYLFIAVVIYIQGIGSSNRRTIIIPANRIATGEYYPMTNNGATGAGYFRPVDYSSSTFQWFCSEQVMLEAVYGIIKMPS